MLPWVYIPVKKKALKVLDEIQKRTEYIYPKAFQMPADEDVEV